MTRYEVAYRAIKKYSLYIEADSVKEAIESFESKEYIDLGESILCCGDEDRCEIICVCEEQ